MKTPKKKSLPPVVKTKDGIDVHTSIKDYKSKKVVRGVFVRLTVNMDAFVAGFVQSINRLRKEIEEKNKKPPELPP